MFHFNDNATMKIQRVVVLLTPQQKSAFEDAARDVGLRLGAWMRQECIAAAKRAEAAILKLRYPTNKTKETYGERNRNRKQKSR